MNMNSSTPDNYAMFEDEVKSNFYFLEQQYGFRRTPIKQVGYAKVIRFESPLIYVNLFYGPPAYEPAISFGRIGIDDAPGAYSFDQGDLVQLNSSAGWKWDPANPNNAVLVELISGLAQVLRECGAACLTGDQATFEEMKARRDSAVKVWHEQERVNGIRKKVLSAWNRKDYGTVVSLYETIKDMLTETENRKLDYAKKQLPNS